MFKFHFQLLFLMVLFEKEFFQSVHLMFFFSDLFQYFNHQNIFFLNLFLMKIYLNKILIILCNSWWIVWLKLWKIPFLEIKFIFIFHQIWDFSVKFIIWISNNHSRNYPSNKNLHNVIIYTKYTIIHDFKNQNHWLLITQYLLIIIIDFLFFLSNNIFIWQWNDFL